MSSSDTEPDIVTVTMPDTGTADGAVLVCWLKRPGEPVDADEPICLVRVGDLEAEVVSPASGQVASLLTEPGHAVATGVSLAEVAIVRAAAPEEADPPPVEPEAPSSEEERLVATPDPLADLASEIGSLEITVPDLELGWAPATPAPPEPEPEVVAAAPEPEPAEPEPVPPEPEPRTAPAVPPPPLAVELRAFRSPAVRRLAAEHAIDLERVEGTGREGRVSREDVLAALAG